MIEDKASGSARSSATSSTRARSSREDFVLPAIKANALYGGGYPLFTALGRPLIAELAVEYARAIGCDTIAHGCTGKGNDQVRIEATVATLAPELKMIAPVRSWQMGREEEIAYAREHGIPVKGGTEARPTRSTTTSGAAPRRAAGSRTSATRPRTTSSSSSPGPRRRPTRRETVTVDFEAGVPVALDGERLGAGRAARTARPRSAAATASASSTTSRTGSSASRCATSTRCRPRRSC